jgi:hypothetical protein
MADLTDLRNVMRCGSCDRFKILIATELDFERFFNYSNKNL